MFTLWLLGCTQIVIPQRGELELEPVTVPAGEVWSVSFEVTGSEEAMSRYYGGEVSALAEDVDLELGNTLSGWLEVGEESTTATLDPEWETTLEMWVKPWGNCWSGACTLGGVLELSATAEASFTPVIVGTLLLETHRKSLPDDATIEIVILD